MSVKDRIKLYSFIAIITLLVCVAHVFGDTPKPAYKVTRISLNDAAISCKSGSAPLVDTKTDGTYIIVTCE